MENTSTEFLSVLKSEFQKRKVKNPKYSMRAYARHLRIDASLLSKIFNQERQVSKKLKIKVLEKFGSQSQVAEHAYKKNVSNELKSTVEKPTSDILKEWYYHLMAEVSKIESDPSKLEKYFLSLGISQENYKQMIDDFAKHENFFKVTNDYWKVVDPEYAAVLFGQTDDVKKAIQKKLLSLCIEGLDKYSIEKRLSTSTMIAMSPDDIPTIKAEVFKFHQKIGKLLKARKSRKKTSVYNIQLALSPILMLE